MQMVSAKSDVNGLKENVCFGDFEYESEKEEKIVSFKNVQTLFILDQASIPIIKKKKTV